MTCCWIAPSRCLNQCWHIKSKALRHLPKGKSIRNAHESICHNAFGNFIFKINGTSTRWQWVNIGSCINVPLYISIVLSLSLTHSLYILIYVYIHVYTHICMYLHVHINIKIFQMVEFWPSTLAVIEAKMWVTYRPSRVQISEPCAPLAQPYGH